MARRGVSAGSSVTSGGSAAPLRVVVPKGALFDDSVRVLSEAGLDTSGLESPSRNLLVGGAGVEFVIAKPTDVPAYVAYGAADCGIGGKDVLLEAELDLVELVDLGFGGCRFVVAEPEGAPDLADRYGHLGVLRVATKYPRIAEQHFARRGVQIEIVKLNGNIELAPLIGIADVIVDITATGTTLRQNHLRIVEDVLPSTARFVANPAALRTDERVVELADTLASMMWAKGIESEARSSESAPYGRDPRP
jgi:ATP phosphoribosyltransferase/ATP phosphoribosyltransferase regulatory subunit